MFKKIKAEMDFFNRLREIIEVSEIDIKEIEYLFIFFKGLIKKHKQHYPKKKDTWKNMDLKELRIMLIDEIDEYFFEYDKKNYQNLNPKRFNPNELLDIAMFCSFLYNRGL